MFWGETFGESNPLFGVCKKDCMCIGQFCLSSILCEYLGQDQYLINMSGVLPLVVVEIGLGPLFVCVRHPEAFGTGSLPAWDFVLGTRSLLFHPGTWDSRGLTWVPPRLYFPPPVLAAALLTDSPNCAMVVVPETAGKEGGVKTVAIACNLFQKNV